MKEEWKDIKGYESRYQVSDSGKIKSLSRLVKCGKGTFLKEEVILKTYVHPLGYEMISLSNEDYKKRTFFVHRIVAENFLKNENKNKYKEINHKDHNKLNNNVNNLEWCDRNYNINEMIKFYQKEAEIFNCIDCNKKLKGKWKRCLECSLKVEKTRINSRKAIRPEKEELLKLIKTKTFVEIGRIYGVSDNAIRKWCKDYELPYRKKDLN